MKRASLWWWALPVVLGLAAALIPAEPTYSPHPFSDHLVLARQILLGSAAVYLAVFLLFRMLCALIAAFASASPTIPGGSQAAPDAGQLASLPGG